MERNTLGDGHLDRAAGDYRAVARIVNSARRLDLQPKDLGLLILARAECERLDGGVSGLAESHLRALYRKVEDLEPSPESGFENRFGGVIDS